MIELKEKLTKEKSLFADIIGLDDIKREFASTILSGRHTLIFGPPGVGKTVLAKNLAKLLPPIKVVEGCVYNCSPENPVCPSCREKKKRSSVEVTGDKRFVRVQGSPDLTAEDLIGDIDPIKAMEFGPLSIKAFTPGKIFKANNGVLFFDEINRCPEKLQNALLQVLQERKATIGSYDLDLDANFILIATMNPEDSSTEKLSDVLLDRFDVIYMSYPDSFDDEKKIVLEKSSDISEVKLEPKVLDLIVYFVRSLRQSPDLEKKPSVRASIGLYERAKANALASGRKKAGIDDLSAVIDSVLAHRIRLKPSIRYLKTPEEFIRKEFEKIEMSDVERRAGKPKEKENKEGDVP